MKLKSGILVLGVSVLTSTIAHAAQIDVFNSTSYVSSNRENFSKLPADREGYAGCRTSASAGFPIPSMSPRSAPARSQLIQRKLVSTSFTPPLY